MIGKQIGNYRITTQIGQGGMGAVYAAKHTMLDKLVAVKVLLPQVSTNNEIVNRFFNEAKATTLIDDPGIVELYDFGHLDDGSAYIVMEYLSGEGMDARVARCGRMPFADAARLIKRIAAVLSAAHRHGIVHRDLKPENIFLVPDPAVDGGERPKVLDFGIAKLGGGLESSTGSNVRTRTGTIIGSPLYMSPEQCKGAGQIDHRADIYSLGCMLFELLCGVPPFNGEGAGEVLAAHIHVLPPNPQTLENSVPPGLANVVLRSLAKNPEARFSSMEEFERSLQRFCDPTQDCQELMGAPTAPINVPEPLVATQYPDAILPGVQAFPAGSMHISGPGPAMPFPRGSMRVPSDPGPDAQGYPSPIANSRAAVPTTLGGASLSGASSGSTDLVAPRSSRNRLLVVSALLLMAGGGISYTLLSGGKASKNLAASESELRKVQVPVAQPDPVVQPEAVLIDEPPATKVTIRIVSDPPAAAVHDSGGTLLGATPYDYAGERGAGKVALVLKHEGYLDQPISFSQTNDHEIDFTLLPQPASRETPKHKARLTRRQEEELARVTAEAGRVAAEKGRSEAEIERQKNEAERLYRVRLEADAAAAAREKARSERVGDGAL